MYERVEEETGRIEKRIATTGKGCEEGVGVGDLQGDKSKGLDVAADALIHFPELEAGSVHVRNNKQNLQQLTIEAR